MHVGVVAFLIFFQSVSNANRDDDMVQLPVISTELLKWGEEMPDENALPVISNPAPAPEPDEMPEVLPEPDPEAEPTPAETVDLNAAPSDTPAPTEQLKPREPERTEDAPQVAYRGETNPHRPTNEHRIQGSPDGFRGGTSLSDSAIRNQLSAIQDQLQRAFRPPRSISESALRSMEARFRISVDASGRIVRWELIRSSGNRQFDTTAEAAFNRFRHGSERLRLSSITDEPLRDQIVAQGFETTMIGR